MTRVTRRMALGGLAASAAACLAPRALVAEPSLTLWGPPAGPSITIAHAIASGALSSVGGSVDLRVWRTPDELRAGLTSGTMNVFVLPTQVAANLFNRGMDVRLVNVMTDGLLYVVSTDPAITAIPDLADRRVAVPFRNDTPDIIFRRLLSAHDMSPERDLDFQSTGTPTEAIQLVVSGRADAALVPEPSATAAILRAGQMGKEVYRAIDVQMAWGEATAGPSVLPQAGLGVTKTFLDDHRATVEALQAGLVGAAQAVNADPAEAAQNAASALDVPAPVIERAIPHSRLVARPARQARGDLEAMYRALADADPKMIGGKLPDDAFYL